MRFMITCRISVEKGNELVKNGTLGETIQSIMEELKPEAAYFVDIEGARGAYITVNMDLAFQIPPLVAPLMLALGVNIQVHPAMILEDLGKATPAFGETCSARTHHKAEQVEARVWHVVSGILKDPERLHAGLDYMIEQESRDASFAGNPTAEMERWLEEISKATRKRARYREMAAEGLLDFEELRVQLAALDAAEQELRTLHRRAEHLAQLERDRDNLLESYAALMPEAINALGSQESHRVYRMIGMEVHLAADGSCELSGDVMNFSEMVISSS